MSRKRKPSADFGPDESTLPKSRPEFNEVLDALQEGGRVAGFETLRDFILKAWRELGLPAQVAIKAVLEVDRHALFAEVAQAKTQSQEKSKRWTWFKDYLEGATDDFMDPVDENKLVPREERTPPPAVALSRPAPEGPEELEEMEED